MIHREFAVLVRKMRQAQAHYFRDRLNLDECRRLEHEVDVEAARLLGSDQAELFGQQTPSSLAHEERR